GSRQDGGGGPAGRTEESGCGLMCCTADPNFRVVQITGERKTHALFPSSVNVRGGHTRVGRHALHEGWTGGGGKLPPWNRPPSPDGGWRPGGILRPHRCGEDRIPAGGTCVIAPRRAAARGGVARPCEIDEAGSVGGACARTGAVVSYHSGRHGSQDPDDRL